MAVTSSGAMAASDRPEANLDTISPRWEASRRFGLMLGSARPAGSGPRKFVKLPSMELQTAGDPPILDVHGELPARHLLILRTQLIRGDRLPLHIADTRLNLLSCRQCCLAGREDADHS